MKDVKTNAQKKLYPALDTNGMLTVIHLENTGSWQRLNKTSSEVAALASASFTSEKISIIEMPHAFTLIYIHCEVLPVCWN